MTPKVEALIQEIRQLSPLDREQVLEAVIQSLPADPASYDLTELVVQYPDEWLAVIIPEAEDRYHPQQGYLVAHSPDRSLVWQQIAKFPANDIYVFFAGQIAAKGFGLIFHDAADTPEVATVVG